MIRFGGMGISTVRKSWSEKVFLITYSTMAMLLN